MTNGGGVLFGIFDGHGGAACGQVQQLIVTDGDGVLCAIFDGHSGAGAACGQVPVHVK